MKYGVEIVIALIVILLAAFTAGYLTRKKYYKEIDRLEAIKLELMHRPVTEQLADVKKLNMTGQTEEMFERWRTTWDDIITSELPNIDEMLFDGEEYTDKYRFNRAKQTFEQIEAALNKIDDKIKHILAELAELIGSEEKNRTEIEMIGEKYKKAKKNLLAHRHTYGIAAERLEELLQSATGKLADYEMKTNQGDYLEARQIVLSLEEEMEKLVDKMELIPDLLNECNTVIPSQKSELSDGYRDMVNDGFHLDHIQMDKQLTEMDEQLDRCKSLLKNADVEEASSIVGDLKEELENLYDLLEKEVYAKHFVMRENDKTGETLDELRLVNQEIIEETNLIQHTYELTPEVIEEPKTFDKSLSLLIKRFELLKEKIEGEQSAYSMLSEELTYIEGELDNLQSRQKEFSEKLHSLRKDELEAREQVAGMQRKINEIIRMVNKSRMPGIPSDFESLFEQGEEQIADVHQSLNGKPLNMKTVQKYLYEAQDTIDHLYERTEEHIENARFAEKVIQYGNRYRATNLELRASLDLAEQAFRNYEYKMALEEAATAVEKVEPGALKRIEAWMNEEIQV